MARQHADDNGAQDTLSASQPVAPETKFETALAELEQIVQRMEGGQLSLEESISAYHRGSELLKHCQGQLQAAESKIRMLENGALRELDPSGEDFR